MSDHNTTNKLDVGWLLCLSALTTVVVLWACNIDFDQAVPCETTDQCPTGFVCRADFGRCIAGAEDAGSGEDVVEDVVEDTDPGDVASDGSGEPDVTTDVVTDTPSDTPTDVPTDVPMDIAMDVPMDGSGDVGCIPSAEICDGMDNDCDMMIDEDGVCGGMGCGMDQVELDDGLGGTFCIDIYEASRQDATAESAGVDDTIATSRPGVMPWNSAPVATAEAACGAAGRRLCTEQEWIRACGGSARQGYPYNQTAYDPMACNGVDSTVGAPVVTGQFTNCVSPDGLFDMSGNVEEWTQSRTTRGGAYDDIDFNMRCTRPSGENADVANPGSAVGFRCCSNP